MAPRTRVKGAAHQEKEQSAQTLPEVEGESAFAQLAKKYWLKPSKKSTKVKVKPEVLKTEIWDILEQGNFKFSDLLSLENLQILER
jgi:intron-binding protein aquarius